MQPEGTADDQLMAFQYFVCLSTTLGNQVPFYPPENYYPEDFELLLQQTKAVVGNGKIPQGPPLSYFGDVQCYDPIIENVTGNRDCLFCCCTGPVDADQPNLNRSWASINYHGQQQMEQEYCYCIQGSLYFLANDLNIPNATNIDTNQFGYCKDKYSNYGNFPPQVYLRISNQLKGTKTLT